MGLPLVSEWEFPWGETLGHVQPHLYTCLARQDWRSYLWALMSQCGTHEALAQGGLRLDFQRGALVGKL